jgi:predicted SAM-dependent methyltransferase
MEDVDLRLDLENVELPDGSAGLVICNHVLEHVNDTKALAELARLLRPGGALVCSVPIVEGWESTYEDPTITDPKLREVHFGQHDHVRLYGRDFRTRLSAAGFTSIEETTCTGADAVTFSLTPGERIFTCRRD